MHFRIVFAEKVFLSPTLIWSPAPNDPLFSANGPCQQLHAEKWNDDVSHAVLTRALQDSLKDVTDHNPALPYPRAARARTLKLINEWIKAADRNPRELLQQYSDVVHWTDVGSWKVLSNLESTDSHPQYRRLAQFLFRTNVAHVLCDHIPYQPHSHRADLICSKFRASNSANINLATSILKLAEQEIGAQLSKDRILGLFGAFSQMESDIPLVLSVILSGTSDPSELITRAVELRKTREAVNYRKWVANLLAAAESGDLDAQLQAEEEIQEAISLLRTELRRMYGDSRRIVARARRLTGNLNADSVPTDLSIGSGLSIGKSLVQWIRRRRLRRKYAIILSVAKSRRDVSQLNSLLPRVFGRQLDTEQMGKFNHLVVQQQQRISSLPSGLPQSDE